MTEDAFTHFNYGWMNRNKIRKSRTGVNLFSSLQDKVDRQLQLMVDDCEGATSPARRATWNVYAATLSTPGNVIKAHLSKKYERLCYILNNEPTITTFYKFLVDANISKPFEWSVEQDSRNVTGYVNSLGDSGISLPDKNYYLDDAVHGDKMVRYRSFLDELFTYAFGSSGHGFDMDSIVVAETRLAKHMPSEADRQNSSKNYNKVSGPDLEKMGLDWTRFSAILGYASPPTHVVLSDVRYFTAVLSILNRDWNAPKMKAYWVYKLLMSFSDFDAGMREIRFRFFGKYLSGQKRATPLKKDALFTACTYMNTYISERYLAKYCSGAKVEHIEDLSERVKVAFAARIEANTWLSSRTKSRAAKKLDKMRFFIGSKSGFIPDPDCDFSPTDGYANYMMFVKWELDKMTTMASAKNDVALWNRFDSGSVYEVNAYYNPLNNEMVLPCGILQSPFMDMSKGIEYSLGYLGATIGHELTHGLDDEGCKYDHSGKYVDWWSEDDEREYGVRQKRLMRLYGEILAADGYGEVDGALSLGENIADVGGLVICEDALESHYDKEGLTPHQRVAGAKVFYKYYCNSWRAKTRAKAKRAQMNTDEHLYSKYRCNGSVMSSERFRTVFGLKEGDRMFNGRVVDIW